MRTGRPPKHDVLAFVLANPEYLDKTFTAIALAMGCTIHTVTVQVAKAVAARKLKTATVLRIPGQGERSHTRTKSADEIIATYERRTERGRKWAKDHAEESRKYQREYRREWIKDEANAEKQRESARKSMAKKRNKK
jgi:hypothetical protein